MALDGGEVHRPGDARRLIQIAQIVGQARVIRDAALVAFEMPHIDRVETHKGREQPPIGFRQCISHQIALL